MSDDMITVPVVEYMWANDSDKVGITAQSVDSIDLSGITGASGNTITITSTAGFNGMAASPQYATMQGAHGASGTVSISSIGAVGGGGYYEVLEERLAKLEKIIAEEEEVRSRCEAVNNAYNEYRLLLVLAKKNKGDLLTEE